MRQTLDAKSMGRATRETKRCMQQNSRSLLSPRTMGSRAMRMQRWTPFGATAIILSALLGQCQLNHSSEMHSRSTLEAISSRQQKRAAQTNHGKLSSEQLPPSDGDKRKVCHMKWVASGHPMAPLDTQ